MPADIVRSHPKLRWNFSLLRFRGIDRKTAKRFSFEFSFWALQKKRKFIFSDWAQLKQKVNLFIVTQVEKGASDQPSDERCRVISRQPSYELSRSSGESDRGKIARIFLAVRAKVDDCQRHLWPHFPTRFAERVRAKASDVRRPSLT